MNEKFKDANGNMAVVMMLEKGYSLIATYFSGTVWKTIRPCKTYLEIKEILRSMSESWIME